MNRGIKSPHKPLNILGFKLITQILDPQSAFAEYEREHKNYVNKYTILIPYLHDTEVPLSEYITAYGIAGSNKIVQFARMYLKARSLVIKSHYDVLTVADSYYMALLGLFIARRYNLGFEVQVHGFEKFSGLRAFLAKKILPKSDSIRVVSIRLKNLLITNFGIPEEKITVASLFLVDTLITAHSAQLDSKILLQKGNDFIFLTISRLVPVKNITLQIKAFKNLLAEYKDTQLWIVGDGPERTKLEAQAKELGIFDRVIFWGRQPDVSPFYVNADTYLLSSDSEGWGLVVVEAAAHRLPIIMTNVGCAGEFIHDGENGLVVPVGDRKAFEGGMIILRGDARLRESLGQSALDSLATLPSKEELIQRYVSSWERASTVRAVE